ncbi:hypothetical protein HYFRA_00007670 [Hymenoscyphus fraxineus]|uniref:t-SNARE affecting a late Golgi compartment protein 1 n=1 Tax=Hymenoscyphus fraxineus TaxID=746836 RepID=A0A9N9PHD9_9HELO|nr:hypothetical protein HYFRA_00007670 [Hymenoscyphus fraxineus]
MMSSTNEEDPFLQVQADVQSTLQTTRPLFTSYLRISSLHPSTKPPSPELLEARKDLQTALESITEDLSDLRASIEAVQSDPYKYGLDTPEIARRRQFIQETASEIEDYYEELAKAPNAVSNSRTTGKRSSSRGGNLQRQDSDPYSSRSQNHNGDDEGTDYNAAFEQQQQLQMLHEQDEQLTSVFRTVGNLRQQADDMGRELEEQGEMLDTMDNLADRVGGRLQTGLKTMGTVIRKNEDGLSSCCIAVLIFVLIILLILVLIL